MYDVEVLVYQFRGASCKCDREYTDILIQIVKQFSSVRKVITVFALCNIIKPNQKFPYSNLYFSFKNA